MGLDMMMHELRPQKQIFEKQFGMYSDPDPQNLMITSTMIFGMVDITCMTVKASLNKSF